MPNVPIVDWRQLDRWGMDERRLPPDAVVKFRDHSEWSEHSLEIVLGIAAILLQSAMIAALLLQRTRRRRVEAEFRESRQLTELATSAGELGMWARNLSTDRVWANPALRSLFGLGDKDELHWSDLVARIHPDDSARVVAEVRGAQDRGQPYEIEFRIAVADGRQRWVLSKGRPATDPRIGRDPGRMGVVIDVTERKRMEETLLRERAYLRQVIDIDPNLIFAKNREGRFTLVNQAVADVFGTTVENIVGKTDADLNPNVAEVEHFRRVDLEVMDTLQERFVAEESITDASGKTRWLQTVKRPIIGRARDRKPGAGVGHRHYPAQGSGDRTGAAAQRTHASRTGVRAGAAFRLHCAPVEPAAGRDPRQCGSRANNA